MDIWAPFRAGVTLQGLHLLSGGVGDMGSPVIYRSIICRSWLWGLREEEDPCTRHPCTRPTGHGFPLTTEALRLLREEESGVEDGQARDLVPVTAFLVCVYPLLPACGMLAKALVLQVHSDNMLLWPPRAPRLASSRNECDGEAGSFRDQGDFDPSLQSH